MFSVTIAITDDKQKKKEEGIFLKVKEGDFRQFKNVVLAFSFGEPLIGKIDEDFIVTDKKTGKDSTEV